MAPLPVQLPVHLKADCSACAALCCVVPPFDAVQGFGFDKPAETPCQHLCADHRCGIHADLRAQGFTGCVAFDGLGAGQRLTAQTTERFGSADWRARPLPPAALAYARTDTHYLLHVADVLRGGLLAAGGLLPLLLVVI